MAYTIRVLVVSLLSFCLLAPLSASAKNSIELFQSKHASHLSIHQLKKIIKPYINFSLYRTIKLQVIVNHKLEPDHILAFLSKKGVHGFTIVRFNIDSHLRVTKVIKNYQLTKEDYQEQPVLSVQEAVCPDNEIEFIAFAPNDDDFEVGITKNVAHYATQHGLKTISLLIKNATRQSYLNYMSCPKLKGNFYDGDANPEVILTNDGLLTYHDIDTILRGKFRYKVTNIWLACEAFNDPIKTSMINTAQSQKYAAGINDLLVGPSDRAAECAMEAAIDGKSMKDSFDACYQQYDNPEDHWGFSGLGSDIFGT